MSDDLLNHLALESGPCVAGPSGHQLNLNGEFASLHALRSGSYTLILPPGRGRVLDAQTGKVLANRIKDFTFPVIAQQTHCSIFE